ncbi:unnamed protein product [Cuscuta epithymum]|uniref:Uncharacterized protein n=1 Tax=Cuscuta epithymum TaxID=186058 RepID=A0AAV0EP49_9ASTE|nr:unnamed protein product [Cuscuta epithymum]
MWAMGSVPIYSIRYQEPNPSNLKKKFGLIMSSAASSTANTSTTVASSGSSGATTGSISSITAPFFSTSSASYDASTSLASTSSLFGSPLRFPRTTSSASFSLPPPPNLFPTSDDAPWVLPVFTWSPSRPESQSSHVPLFSQTVSSPTINFGSSFAGPTFAGAPRIAPLTPSASIGPIAPRSSAMPNPGFSLSELVKNIGFSALNITNIVTTKLAIVEDYLTWRIQFEPFLVSNGFLGILDGSIPAPSPYIYDAYHHETINPDYYNLLKLDQTVRSWLFATLSRDVLIEVRDLKNAFAIWNRLESHFMSASLACSMEQKQKLTHSKKRSNQSMDQYLRDIKDIADRLVAINAPVSKRELFQSILLGLGRDYEYLITSVDLFPDSFTFENLQTKLVAKERSLQYMNAQEENPAHAFASQTPLGGQPPHGGGQPQQGGQQPPAGGQQQHSGGGHRGRGNCGRGQRGRGGRGQRGRGGYGYLPQFSYSYPLPGYFP